VANWELGKTESKLLWRSKRVAEPDLQCALSIRTARQSLAPPGYLHPNISNDLRDPRTLNAKQISMNTRKLGIPSTVRSSDDHLIPAQPLIPPPLILRLAASHAEVLEKWNRNFGLDLRWPKAVVKP
jgi:hypothetical protein